MLNNVKNIPAEYRHNEYGESFEIREATKELDWPKFVEWRTKTTTLLAQVLPREHVHFKAVEQIPSLQPTVDQVQWGISTLKAIKNDLEEGFLDELFSKIEAEIAGDYMGQAEALLKEGQRGKYDHVPAAVLTGAVLEKALRTLCIQQQPQIALSKANGEPKTMNPLIDDLERVLNFELRKGCTL